MTEKYPLLTRKQLEIINRKSLAYSLAIAEKDYMLALVSKVIYDSPLKSKIVFKGGTAIHHCYLQQTRFSEDLDFSCLDHTITYEEVKRALEIPGLLEVKEHYTSKATIKISRLKYQGPLGLPNSLKVEIDFLQNIVLAAKEALYHNVWGISTHVKVMDVKEIIAEKIRATSDRARYRDFYDLTLLLEKYPFNLDSVFELIKQKEIRKPISQKSIMQNWNIALLERNTEASRIYYAHELEDSKILQLIEKLQI